MKGQVTIEFVLLCAAAMLLVTIVIASANFNTALAREKNEQEALSDLANYIQQEIVLASDSYPVYVKYFKLPQKIVGKDYTATIQEYLLTVNTSRFTENRGIPLVKSGWRTLYTGQNNNITKTTEQTNNLKINC